MLTVEHQKDIHSGLPCTQQGLTQKVATQLELTNIEGGHQTAANTEGGLAPASWKSRAGCSGKGLVYIYNTDDTQLGLVKIKGRPWSVRPYSLLR